MSGPVRSIGEPALVPPPAVAAETKVVKLSIGGLACSSCSAGEPACLGSTVAAMLSLLHTL